MLFNEALKLMKQGVPMKLPSWGGFWCWNEEKQTIEMHCRPQDSDKGQCDVLDIRETQRVEYTLLNVCSDEWIPATEENCTLLGGTPSFSFSEALKYLKRGMKVARKNWNAKDQYITLLDPYNTEQFTLQEEAPLGTFYPYLVIKTNYNGIVPWFPSATDVLAEDWVFAE